ncbi:ExbD/TolR family protein [Pseudomonadota bacterium]
MKGNKFKEFHKKSDASINLTPFVDILFVLLIVFMITTPIMLGGVTIDLPKGEKLKEIAVGREPVPVTIKRDGTIYVREDRIKLRLLPQKLMSATNGDLNTTIFVRADGRLNYERVIKVVSKIYSTGFDEVSLVTELSELEE